MEKVSNLLARIFVGTIFLIAGFNKIGGYEGTQAYMEAMGVPGMLLPLVIFLEIGGALLIIIGWKIQYSAYALAGFTLLAGFIFHSNFSDQMQTILFMKNIAIIGGLFAIANLPIKNSFSLENKLKLSPSS